MTNLTQKLVIGGAALVVGLVAGWAVRGVTGYNTNTQAMTSYDSWRLACPAAAQKDVSCEIVQDILDSQSHRKWPASPSASRRAASPRSTSPCRWAWRLEPGIGLRFGTDPKEPLRTEKYRTCTQQGCIVDIVDRRQAAGQIQ